MKIRLLSTALLAGLAFSAGAQEFDDRWYLTGSAGMNIQDNDRGTRNTPFAAIGLGKFISPHWSVDGELNYQNPNMDADQDLNWSQYGISLDMRRHFLADGRNWNPYALLGVGYQRSEEEFDAFPSPDSPGQREDGNFAAKLGLGLQGDLGRIGVRTELAYRADFDDQSVNAPDKDGFGDLLASVGVVIPPSGFRKTASRRSTRTTTSPPTSAPACSSISAASTCAPSWAPASTSTKSRRVRSRSRKATSPTCSPRSA